MVEVRGPGADRFPLGARVTAPLWPGFGSGQGTWQQYVCAAEQDLVGDLPVRMLAC